MNRHGFPDKAESDPRLRAEAIVMASLWVLVAILVTIIAIEPQLTGARGIC